MLSLPPYIYTQRARRTCVAITLALSLLIALNVWVVINVESARESDLAMLCLIIDSNNNETG